MISRIREITKEQYDKIDKSGTYVSDEDEWIIFSGSEILGYGVYCPRVYQSGDKYNIMCPMRLVKVVIKRGDNINGNYTRREYKCDKREYTV